MQRLRRIARPLVLALVALAIIAGSLSIPTPTRAAGASFIGWLLAIVDTAPGGEAYDYEITTVTGDTLGADCATPGGCWGGPALGPVDLIGLTPPTIRDLAGQYWTVRP